MTIRRALVVLLQASLLLAVFAAGWIAGRIGTGSVIDPALLPEFERQFAERMRGVTMVGSFTVTGREDRPARPDRYDIESVEKIAEDRWRFNARIGESGPVLPIPVTMRFVDDTPIIMMTDMTIPAMGTFTARVFFYRDLYAGTWQNQRTGGHMFGRIEARKP